MKYSRNPVEGRLLGCLRFQSFFDDNDILELYITDESMKEGFDFHMNEFKKKLEKYLKDKMND